MRSNLKGFFVVGLAFFAMSGCSYLFGPRPEESKLVIKADSSSCIKDVPANLKLWLSSSRSDIGSSVDCAVGAINDFSSRVHGQTKSVYTKGELARFVTEILKGKESTNESESFQQIEEILRFKQILFGGARDFVTKDELARLKSLLLRVRPLLLEVTPSLQLLLFKASSANRDQVTVARQSLTKILEMIASELESNEVGRPETRFTDLVSSAGKLGLETESVESVEKWIPLAEAVKGLVQAGEPNLLRSRDWAPLTRTIAKGWGLALRVKYNVSGNSEYLGQDFPMFVGVVREVDSLLDSAVAAHGGEIRNEMFENLIDALQLKKMMPFGILPETAKNLLPVIFGKLLYGRSLPNFERHGLHFGTEQLAELRSITKDWIAGQIAINSVIGTRPVMSIAAFESELAVRKLVQKDFADRESLMLAGRAQKQILQLFVKGRPPVSDEKDRLIVVAKKDLPEIRKADLNSLNLVRTAFSSVIRGWTHDRSAAEAISGLLEGEVQETYMDFRAMGKDLNFIDIRSNSAGVRTFMENAIFLSSSDGDERMSLGEGVEWFHFVVSGGSIADALYKKVLAHRWSGDGKVCGVARKDVLGRPKQRPDCFREGFLTYWDDFMPNLPRLIEWVRKDGSGARGKAILTAVENAGRARGASQALVDSSEFRSMIPILHYLESIFARFDANQDDILQKEETWKAFPLLFPFIKKMGRGAADGEDVQTAILAWILKWGTLPDTSIAGKAKLLAWYLFYDWYDLSTDRERILNVIGSFGQAAKKNRTDDIKVFYEANKTSLRALVRTQEPNTAAKLADLFQCLSGGTRILASDMALNSNFVTPAGAPLDADQFIARVKRVIDIDARLEMHCLPF